jgi:hypothetical protein
VRPAPASALRAARCGVRRGLLLHSVALPAPVAQSMQCLQSPCGLRAGRCGLQPAVRWPSAAAICTQVCPRRTGAAPRQASPSPTPQPVPGGRLHTTTPYPGHPTRARPRACHSYGVAANAMGGGTLVNHGGRGEVQPAGFCPSRCLHATMAWEQRVWGGLCLCAPSAGPAAGGRRQARGQRLDTPTPTPRQAPGGNGQRPYGPSIFTPLATGSGRRRPPRRGSLPRRGLHRRGCGGPDLPHSPPAARMQPVLTATHPFLRAAQAVRSGALNASACAGTACPPRCRRHAARGFEPPIAARAICPILLLRGQPTYT